MAQQFKRIHMFQLPFPVRDANASQGDQPLGNLPEWNLDDLYTGEDAPELERDLNWLEDACASFAADDHAGDPWTFMIKVIGSKGATRYSYRDWVENTPAVVHSQTYSAYPYTIRATGKYFLDKVIAHNKEPLSSLDDAVTCMKIIEACETSVEEERHVTIE